MCIYLCDGISVFVIESAPCNISSAFCTQTRLRLYKNRRIVKEKEKKKKIESIEKNLVGYIRTRFTLGVFKQTNKRVK